MADEKPRNHRPSTVGIVDDSAASLHGEDTEGLRDFPTEALEILEDVVASFKGDLPAEWLETGRSFLLDVMAAHPLGHLLAERLREPTTTAQTEERTAAGREMDDDETKRAGGAG